MRVDQTGGERSSSLHLLESETCFCLSSHQSVADILLFFLPNLPQHFPPPSPSSGSGLHHSSPALWWPDWPATAILLKYLSCSSYESKLHKLISSRPLHLTIITYQTSNICYPKLHPPWQHCERAGGHCCVEIIISWL